MVLVHTAQYATYKTIAVGIVRLYLSIKNGVFYDYLLINLNNFIKLKFI